MKLAYIEKNFREESLGLIHAANIIIKEYTEAGYSLTLRQLYYQFVARGWLENRQKEYDKLGSLISDARMAGWIDWEAIEDRTRYLRGVPTVSSAGHAIQKARDVYAEDLWKGQDWRPEVWIEKDALVGVIAPICDELRINFFACRGYNSQSEQWRAGRRMAEYYTRGQRPIVFHLGDHDPSGLDMTRDNQERLSLFAGTQVQVVRLALNWDQVEQYNPPPNPAKMTDSRAEDYVARYGNESWELDALPPDAIARLIRDAVERVRNSGPWSEALAQEAASKDELDQILEGLS